MIRLMTVEDIQTVVDAEEDLFGHTLGYEMIHNEIMVNDFAHYFILEDESFTGYAGIWVNDDIGQIVNFLVTRPRQGLGYGKMLLGYIMDFFMNKGVHVISLEVKETNLVAIKLYESFGFVKSYRRVGYYDNNIDAHVMIWRDKHADISSRK